MNYKFFVFIKLILLFIALGLASCKLDWQQLQRLTVGTPAVSSPDMLPSVSLPALSRHLRALLSCLCPCCPSRHPCHAILQIHCLNALTYVLNAVVSWPPVALPTDPGTVGWNRRLLGRPPRAWSSNHRSPPHRCQRRCRQRSQRHPVHLSLQSLWPSRCCRHRSATLLALLQMWWRWYHRQRLQHMPAPVTVARRERRRWHGNPLVKFLKP